MARVYSTSFPIRQNKTIEDLTQSIRIWITGSPHRDISEADLEKLSEDGFHHAYDKGDISAARIATDKGDVYGMRLMEKNGSGVRTTDVVGALAKNRFDVAISHDYELYRLGDKPGKTTKPRIVNALIEALGGGFDGTTLKVQKTPHWASEGDLEFVAEVVNNKSDNRLPVVYVSKDNRNLVTVHPNRLAYLLGGMAHVLVEPSRQFSFDLRKLTFGNNTYNGVIGVYWPNGWRSLVFPDATKDLVQEIYGTIEEHSLYSLLPKALTYDGIKSAQAKRRFEAMKEDKKATVEDALSLAVGEIDSRDKEISNLKQTVHSLEQKVASLNSKRSVQGELLKGPQFTELYSGELHDFVIGLLEGQLKNVQKDSRAYDALTAVIAANKQSERREELVGELDRIFKSCPKTISEAILKEIRSLGFEVEYGGKHIKVYVPGHESRKYNISKTSSDHRGRKNELSGIKRKLL